MPGRTLLLDANVLLLLFVGLHDRRRISHFKNTAQFTEEDFDLLVEIVAQFDMIAATPHVLTEVSNLAGQLGEPGRSQLFEGLRTQLTILSEPQVAVASAVTDEGFVRLGVTDAAISVLTRGDPQYVVLTADLDLWIHLTRAGVNAENFNHLRRIA